MILYASRVPTLVVLSKKVCKTVAFTLNAFKSALKIASRDLISSVSGVIKSGGNGVLITSATPATPLDFGVIEMEYGEDSPNWAVVLAVTTVGLVAAVLGNGDCQEELPVKTVASETVSLTVGAPTVDPKGAPDGIGN